MEEAGVEQIRLDIADPLDTFEARFSSLGKAEGFFLDPRGAL
jgi:hypothetical protein